MLLLLLALSVHAAPELKSSEPPASQLSLIVGTTGGFNLADVEGGVRFKRGPVFGARAGFRVSMPPAIPRGARAGVMPMLVLRYEPVGGRLEWFADAALTLEFSRFVFVVSAGYGLASMRGDAPRQLISVGNRVVLTLGQLWLGVGLDTTFRLASGGRTFELSALVGWQLGL